MANYIDNKSFFRALVEYYKECDEAEAEGNEAPQIPDYIGQCFMQIAERLAMKSNFNNYTYKADMIGDGIENAVVAARKFDPEKSNNPFAYFTQIIYNAFIRRIEKEKKHSYIKHKSLEQFFIDNPIQEGDAMGGVTIDYERSHDLIEKFEKKKEAKKKKKGLENFYDDEQQVPDTTDDQG